MKSKRTYKIIACVSIWLSVIIAIFGVATFKSSKVKAGVVVDESTHYTLTNLTTIYANDPNLSNDYYYIGVSQAQITNSNGVQIAILCHTQGLTNTAFRVKNFRFDFSGWQGQFQGGGSWNIQGGTPSGFKFDYVPPTTLLDDGIVYLSIQDIFTKIGEIGNNSSIWEANNFTPYLTLYSQAYIKGFFIKESSATIAPVNNIYDLQQGDVALIYLSDISGLSNSAYRDEITINWGYIDSTDNTLYAVHAPTVSAQRTDNNIISLAMPINAAGDATSYYSIDQSAILSTISSGGATATAHIYGIYVWIQQSRIQWGLAEFDTSGLPASGASMNYITSLTSLYDYTAINTSTMTCRLSISDNFNFITIKNQPILSAYNINTVIQQGGFLPAWAVYNWARGSSAGYTSGEQAGAAPYQPGGAGYQEIYEAGRQAGIAENIGTVNWFVSAFQAVDAMLNIRIFPNITIGYLVGIPFVISVVWFIIRMFRGGGSSS